MPIAAARRFSRIYADTRFSQSHSRGWETACAGASSEDRRKSVACLFPSVLDFPVLRDLAMAIQRVGIIGAGTMGNGIAHVFARSGYDVLLCDLEQKFLDR